MVVNPPTSLTPISSTGNTLLLLFHCYCTKLLLHWYSTTIALLWHCCSTTIAPNCYCTGTIDCALLHTKLLFEWSVLLLLLLLLLHQTDQTLQWMNLYFIALIVSNRTFKLKTADLKISRNGNFNPFEPIEGLPVPVYVEFVRMLNWMDSNVVHLLGWQKWGYLMSVLFFLS